MIVEINSKIINFREEEEDEEAITQPLTDQCQPTSQTSECFRCHKYDHYQSECRTKMS